MTRQERQRRAKERKERASERQRALRERTARQDQERQERYEERRDELLARRDAQRSERQRAKDARNAAPTEREQAIRSEIAATMGPGLSVRKEVRYLPDIMEPDEIVKGAARGTMGADSWLVVCTDRRVIFVDKGLVTGFKQMEIPLEMISSVSHRVGPLTGSVEILGAGLTGMAVKNIVKENVVAFARAVQAARREHTT